MKDEICGTRKIFFSFIVFAFAVSPFAGEKIKEKDLPEKYRDWLNLVSYIILPVEKDVFLELSNDRERDIFIDTFWKQRDPTPGTPQNEYKEEHVRRFIHANTSLRTGSPRQGWMTDMGRIYIILGPPHSIERFDSTAGEPALQQNARHRFGSGGCGVCT